MYRVNQVLIPVDFSSFSRCALTFAQRLGQSDEDGEPATLQMAHAVEAMPPYIRSVLFPYAAMGEDDRVFEAEIEDSVRKDLATYFEVDDDLRQRFTDDPQIEFGSSKEWIRKWATRFDVDMIAMGAFGEDGVFSGGPGSTSRRITSTSTKPVALIRDFDGAVNIDRVLAAVDLGRDARRVVDVALGLALELGAELQLLHVIPTPFVHDTKWMLERSLDIDADDVEAAIRPQAEGVFSELIEDVEISFAHQQSGQQIPDDPSIRFGDPATEIAAAAYNGDADLVVVGRGGRERAHGVGVGRVASALMAGVPTHLVVVPGERDGTPLKRWGG